MSMLRHTIEAVNHSLQDICSNDCPFGGITVVFGGDFQQTLPVIVHGTQEDSIQASLQRSHLWNNMQVLYLCQNMRVDSSPNCEAFFKWLLNVGHGWSSLSQHTSDIISIPESMYCETENNLIASMYGPLSQCSCAPHPDFFQDRAILAGRNKDIHSLNSNILSMLPGEDHKYMSANSYTIELLTACKNENIPIKFFHTLKASGLPIADLHLKIGCPIILLCNLDTCCGLCNRT